MTDIELLLQHGNTWNHLTVYKKYELSLIFKYYWQNVFTNIYLIYMHKPDLALNNVQ